MALLTVSKALLRLFRERRIFHALRRGERWRIGETLSVGRECFLEPYAQIFAGIMLPRRMGAFSYSHSQLSQDAEIGRYCSIGQRVSWMGEAHQLDWATTSPFSSGPDALQGVMAFHADYGVPIKRHPGPPFDPSTRIGHDVWIGDEAMIAPGVTIGTGAIVGARALVLKDVEPYAIVVGQPARMIRRRFADPIAEALLAAEWWRYAPDLLQELSLEDPEAFLRDFQERRVGAREITARPLTFGEIVAAATASEGL